MHAPTPVTPISPEVVTWERFLELVGAIPRNPTKALLFRGQANSDWRLETTLERTMSEPDMPVQTYYRVALVRARPQIESLTTHRWDHPTYQGLVNWFRDYDGFSTALSSGNLPHYEYFLYLRHHGFPSPLLDWTRSVYVAAYFAFIEPNDAEARAIYVWQQPDVSGGGTDECEVYRLGPFVRSHPRHVFQQSEYTIGVRFDTSTKRPDFVNQEDVLRAENKTPQTFWKFSISSKERQRVLSFLQDCNITPHSLFGSEESLMHTLALREFHLKKKDTSS